MSDASPRPTQERREALLPYLPALVLVTDWSRLRGRTHRYLVQAAAEGGVSILHLRDRWPAGVSSNVRRGRSLDAVMIGASLLGARSTAGSDVLILIHGGDDAAAWVAATNALDGDFAAHLPERPQPGFSLPPQVARIRQQCGEDLIISRSVHSVEAARQAERDGADMLVLGTVFPSPSHPGGETIGIAGVRAVCDAVTVPVIGIGGVTAENAGDVIRAGASGVAVISAIFDAPDPRTAAAELRAAVDEAWHERHIES